MSIARPITQRELCSDPGVVLRAVEVGETFTITRNGTAIAELQPVPPGRMVPRERIAIAASGPLRADAGRLRADLEEFIDPLLDD